MVPDAVDAAPVDAVPAAARVILTPPALVERHSSVLRKWMKSHEFSAY